MCDLQPGPEMDAAVARAIGWQIVCAGPDSHVRKDSFDKRPMHPSTDIADAFAALTLVDSMITARVSSEGEDSELLIEGFFVEWRAVYRHWFCGISATWSSDPAFTGYGAEAPESICRAILAWAEVCDGNR
jgi:hypothetical protein